MKRILPVWLLLLAGILHAAGLAAQGRRPNIVLIVADDHGREALGCYGNRHVRTPHIDRLAAAGTRCSQAFSTVASCSPSRSVLLTGLYSHANGMYGLEHQQHHFSSFNNVQSLPVLLQRAGYRTARIGKLHVAPEQVYHFQQVLGGGQANDPRSVGRSPVEMADLCKSFISEAADQPFFLYFATDDPHRSNTVKADGSPFFDEGRPNTFGNRPGGYPQVTATVFRPEAVEVPAYLPDNAATRQELAAYYQSIARLDQGVGRLVAHLQATGQYDNTLIIYLSDNGAPFPGAKTTLYDPGILLPCIIKPPRPQKPGFVQDAMISWADITPTLLDFAGAPAPATLQGRSFKDIIEQERVKGWDEIYGSHTLHEITMYYPMRALRERKLKLIHNLAYQLPFPLALDLYQSYTWQHLLRSPQPMLGKRPVNNYLHRPEFELYDIQQDPEELHNLAADPRYAGELQRMQEKLRAFRQRTRDPWAPL